MFRPKAQVRSALELSPQWLQQRGLRGLMLDLDNTLIPYGVYGETPAALRAWLDQLQHAGFKIILVSNGSSRRVRYWTAKLGVSGFGPAFKPWFGFSRGLRELGLAAEQTAAVGDQLFTDVLGGNLVGAYTVLVEPLSQRELPYTQVIRRIERVVLGNSKNPIANEDSDPNSRSKGPTIEDDTGGRKHDG